MVLSWHNQYHGIIIVSLTVSECENLLSKKNINIYIYNLYNHIIYYKPLKSAFNNLPTSFEIIVQAAVWLHRHAARNRSLPPPEPQGSGHQDLENLRNIWENMPYIYTSIYIHT